mgnify:CR=1 FL=1
MEKPKEIVLVTHYEDCDSEFVGDYAYLEIFFDGELVFTGGDSYHDKGEVRGQSWLEGVEYALGELPDVVYVKKADVPF